MVSKNRADIYEYLYGVFSNAMTNNVYFVNAPQDLTDKDANDGFVVLRVGEIRDESEFSRSAFARARCYAYAYTRANKRGKLDFPTYKSLETSVEQTIQNAANKGGAISILNDTVISMDTAEFSNADNPFFVFAKSFVVSISE